MSEAARIEAPRRLTIATRKSALALWQAEHIRARLAAMYPASEVTLLGLTTEGDRVQDRPLAAVGGKGLFIKELELAMADGRADLAVHSLKDVPMDMPDGFALAAITAREDARDAFVSNRFLDLAGLPGGARIGTSSLRREAQLRERDPLLSILPLRGNVNTRLAKLDDGRYDAIILAAAGLKRLGFAGRIASYLDPEESLPAAGQGALAVECRSRSRRPPRGTRAARGSRHDARDDGRAVVRSRSFGKLPYAARGLCDIRPRRVLVARASREPRRRNCPAGETAAAVAMTRRRRTRSGARSRRNSWRAAPRNSSPTERPGRRWLIR